MRGHQGPGSPQQRGKRNSQRQLEAKLSRRKSPRPLRQGLIAIRYTAIYVANRVVDPETGTWNLADNFSDISLARVPVILPDESASRRRGQMRTRSLGGFRHIRLGRRSKS